MTSKVTYSQQDNNSLDLQLTETSGLTIVGIVLKWIDIFLRAPRSLSSFSFQNSFSREVVVAVIKHFGAMALQSTHQEHNFFIPRRWSKCIATIIIVTSIVSLQLQRTHLH